LDEHTTLEGYIPAETARVQSQDCYFVGRRSSGYSHELTSCVALLVVVSQSSHDVCDGGGGGGRIRMEREVMSFIRPANRPRKKKKKSLRPCPFSRPKNQQ